MSYIGEILYVVYAKAGVEYPTQPSMTFKTHEEAVAYAGNGNVIHTVQLNRREIVRRSYTLERSF